MNSIEQSAALNRRSPAPGGSVQYVIQQHFINQWDDVRLAPNEEIGRTWLHDEGVKSPRPHRLIKRTEQLIAPNDQGEPPPTGDLRKPKSYE